MPFALCYAPTLVIRSSPFVRTVYSVACSQAFLCTDNLRGMEPGHLIALDAKAAAAASRPKVIPMVKTSADLGAAGYALRRKKWHIKAAGDVDIKAHPDVDLDPAGAPYFTIPLLNTLGAAVACLQMVVGPGSPKVALVDGKVDNVTFEQAAQWLVRALRAPLGAVLYLLADDGPNASSASTLTMIRSPKSAKSMRWGSPSPTTPNRQSSALSAKSPDGAGAEAAQVDDDDEASERLFEMRHGEFDEVREQLADVLKVPCVLMAPGACHLAPVEVGEARLTCHIRSFPGKRGVKSRHGGAAGAVPERDAGEDARGGGRQPRCGRLALHGALAPPKEERRHPTKRRQGFGEKR